jgi:alkylhydroperoxidase family enzyme
LARRLGAKEEWLAALRRETPELETSDEGSEDGLEPGWLAALRYAEAVNQGGHHADDAIYEELAKYWDEAEIIEITRVIGLFAYFNRVNDALRVDITK